MAKYETAFIIKAALGETEREAIFKQITEAITKNGGKVIKKEVWIDKHRLAFSIKKNRDVTYLLVGFEVPAAAILRLNQAWKLNENILRFLTTKVEESR